MDAIIRFLIIISVLLTAATPGMAQSGAESKNRCVGGDTSAPVIIEVFSCYQCPPCRNFYLETVSPLLKEYARYNKVCVIYYEFPLEIHDYAMEAAKYGEAARSLGQDKWQRVSEALYQHLDEWRTGNKIEPIVSSVLSQEEMDRVRKLIEDPSIRHAIEQDIAEGSRRHVEATPTFFIHAKGKTKRIVGTVSYALLKNYIDGLLK